MRLTTPILAALALGLAAGGPAGAASFTAIALTTSQNGVGNCSPGGAVTGPGTVSIGKVCGDAVGVESSQAVASFGHVSARSDATTFGGSSLDADIGAVARATDTLIFTSSDPTATFADVSANLIFHGLLNATGNPAFSGFSNAGIGGYVELGGVFSFFGYNLGSSSGFTGSSQLGVTSGVIGPTSDALWHTATVRVGLNTPVFFEMDLESSAGAGGPASALSDFSGSFKLPTGVDAFNLPTGVTVNAGDYLVNNRFHDPLAAGVPEPAGWALMIAGFGLVGGALRRRRLIPAA